MKQGHRVGGPYGLTPEGAISGSMVVKARASKDQSTSSRTSLNRRLGAVGNEARGDRGNGASQGATSFYYNTNS